MMACVKRTEGEAWRGTLTVTSLATLGGGGALDSATAQEDLARYWH